MYTITVKCVQYIINELLAIMCFTIECNHNVIKFICPRKCTPVNKAAIKARGAMQLRPFFAISNNQIEMI